MLISTHLMVLISTVEHSCFFVCVLLYSESAHASFRFLLIAFVFVFNRKLEASLKQRGPFDSRFFSESKNHKPLEIANFYHFHVELNIFQITLDSLLSYHMTFEI